MKLGIVYHMPFWRAADGTLREIEGSFARYVDSLAPYFDEISLCVPVLSEPRGEGTAIRASNVTLAALPAFDGPVQFYPKLPGILPKLWKWARGIDVLHCRIPSPAAIFAFEFARLSSRPPRPARRRRTARVPRGRGARTPRGRRRTPRRSGRCR